MQEWHPCQPRARRRSSVPELLMRWLTEVMHQPNNARSLAGCDGDRRATFICAMHQANNATGYAGREMRGFKRPAGKGNVPPGKRDVLEPRN